jgi:hypothetical protein
VSCGECREFEKGERERDQEPRNTIQHSFNN